MIGSVNGILIFVFTEVYKFLSLVGVKWENHRFQTEEENSFVLKTFIFNFFLSYLNLFYYGLFLQDFDKLSLNFITILISKNILFLFKINLLPKIIYYFKKKNLIKKWIKIRKERKVDMMMEIYAQDLLFKYAADFNIEDEILEKL